MPEANMYKRVRDGVENKIAAPKYGLGEQKNKYVCGNENGISHRCNVVISALPNS